MRFLYWDVFIYLLLIPRRHPPDSLLIFTLIFERFFGWRTRGRLVNSAAAHLPRRQRAPRHTRRPARFHTNTAQYFQIPMTALIRHIFAPGSCTDIIQPCQGYRRYVLAGLTISILAYALRSKCTPPIFSAPFISSRNLAEPIKASAN
jgi:hypothetical protein